MENVNSVIHPSVLWWTFYIHIFMSNYHFHHWSVLKLQQNVFSLSGTQAGSSWVILQHSHRRQLVLGSCFVDPLCGNVSFGTSFAWPPSLLSIRDVIHVLQSPTVNQASALQAGMFSRLASEQHWCSEQTSKVDATWDTPCIQLRLEQIFFVKQFTPKTNVRRKCSFHQKCF